VPGEVSGQAVYEAVNKPSRAKFFVGMHNEMVGKRTVKRAAFVCFKAAEVGGEFILVDGRRMLRDLEPEFLKRCVQPPPFPQQSGSQRPAARAAVGDATF